MMVLDFVGVHNLCARVFQEQLDATTIFTEPDAEGWRVSPWGRLHDRNYDEFLERVRSTASAENIKAKIVANWNKENMR